MTDPEETPAPVVYSVVITPSDGYAESPQGEFASYLEAYSAFERAVHLVDEISSKEKDFPLTFDTVRLLRDGSIVHLWQRPPWKTEQLLVEWGHREGYGTVQPVRIKFLGLAATSDQHVVLDRAQE